MRYNGGKQRIAKHLAKIINGLNPSVYTEPFCGMCSVGRLVNSPVKRFYDIDEATVAVVNAADEGFSFPVTATEEEYRAARALPPSNPLHGFFKYGCSFAGKPWGGFARSTGRNYALNASNQLRRLKGQGVRAEVRDYQTVPLEGVVYCDPPYACTTACGSGQKFDSNVFWDWAERASQRCTVLVSEYSAPDNGWMCVFENVVTDGLVPKDKPNVERLFMRCATRLFSDHKTPAPSSPSPAVDGGQGDTGVLPPPNTASDRADGQSV